MKKTWRLFAYPVMDIKAAEAMLNRRAVEGWRLEAVHLGLLARFVPTEEPLSYCLDWYDPEREDGADYTRLLADAGWYLAAQTGYWNIYQAPAGTPPIQTDAALEFLRFRKKSLRRMLFGWGVVLALVLGLTLVLALLAPLTGKPAWMYWLEFLAQYNTVALAVLCLPLLAVGGLLWSGRLLLRLSQWKRAAAAELPFPVPGRRSALAARLLVVAGNALLLLFLLALLMDVVTGAFSRPYLVGAILASLLFAALRQGPEYQRARKGRAIYGAVACVLLVLSLLPLSWLGNWLRVSPPLEGQSLFPAADVEDREDTATFLAAHTKWSEWWYPDFLPEHSYMLDARAEGWVLAWDWLADRVQQALTGDGMEPRPGYEGVWTGPDSFVLRRGSTILWIEDTLGSQWEERLEDILYQMEPGQ